MFGGQHTAAHGIMHALDARYVDEAPGTYRVFATQFHAAGERRLVRTLPSPAHVAGGNAAHGAVFVVEHLGPGKAGIDFDPERFGLPPEPAADAPQPSDVAVMVVHQR